MLIPRDQAKDDSANTSAAADENERLRQQQQLEVAAVDRRNDQVHEEIERLRIELEEARRMIEASNQVISNLQSSTLAQPVV